MFLFLQVEMNHYVLVIKLLSQLQPFHCSMPYIVLYPTLGCWGWDSKPHYCLVSSLYVGLFQQGVLGNLHSWGGRKDLAPFCQVHLGFLILSGPTLSHFTLAAATESNRNHQIQFAVSLTLAGSALSNSPGGTSMKQEASFLQRSGFQALQAPPLSF